MKEKNPEEKKKKNKDWVWLIILLVYLAVYLLMAIEDLFQLRLF